MLWEEELDYSGFKSESTGNMKARIYLIFEEFWRKEEQRSFSVEPGWGKHILDSLGSDDRKRERGRDRGILGQ